MTSSAAVVQRVAIPEQFAAHTWKRFRHESAQQANIASMLVFGSGTAVLCENIQLYIAGVL
jgi:hypothetical protein